MLGPVTDYAFAEPAMSWSSSYRRAAAESATPTHARLRSHHHGTVIRHISKFIKTSSVR